MPFTGSAPAPRVSMEITDDMLKSMEVGLAFRDYVSNLSSSLQFIYASMVHDGRNMTLLLPNKRWKLRGN